MEGSGPLRVWEAPRPAEVGDDVEAFLRRLGGPTWIRVPGRDRSRVRALATLLHGNEPSGARSVHAWLRSGAKPAVDAVIFLGAVEAALAPPGFAYRMQPGRRDLNRCFAPPFEGHEGEVAAEVLRLLRAANCENLVDLHNITGHSPTYAIGTRVDDDRLALTALFTDRFVHSDLRLGTLIEETEDDLPGIAIECGRSGDPAADAAALAGLQRYLGAERIERRPAREPTILVAPIRVRVRDGLRVAFGDRPVDGADLTVVGDIDRHNFESLGPGIPVGWVRTAGLWPIEARGADGRDVSREFFGLRGDLLELRRGGVPIMITTDPAVAESDCLFYLVRPCASGAA